MTSLTPEQQRRLNAVADILDGFTDGIDGDRLMAGMAFVKFGSARPYPQNLINLFASVHYAAIEESAWSGDPGAEANFEIDQLMTAVTANPDDFQNRIQSWMLLCFGETITADGIERNYRFLEEAIELVQALGCAREDAHRLVDYVFGRDIGKPYQEVGGVMVALAALCNAAALRMSECGEIELKRINAPVVIEKIRAKQATKPRNSPLPGAGMVGHADVPLEIANAALYAAGPELYNALNGLLSARLSGHVGIWDAAVEAATKAIEKAGGAKAS